MPPRYDTHLKTLRLSVADLLDAQLARSIGFANRGGYERMWLGQAIHSRYQEQAIEDDPTYRREVRLEHVFNYRGWQIQVQGRLDGLRREDDGTLVVEEIKSVRRGQQLMPQVRELYERQAMLYAWMLRAEQQDAAQVIRAELLLIEIGGESVERHPVELNWKGIEAAVRRRLHQLLRAFEKQQAAREKRRLVAEGLAFPYEDMRPGQQRIIDEVESALDAGEHRLIEAPTGIGKTVTSLYPVLRHALAHDRRVFVLTAKNLQQDMAMQVIELLNEDASFSSLRIRAKARMCANDQVICHEEYCRFARDYYLKMQQSGISQQLLAHYPNLEPDVIFAHARRGEVCPFEVSLDLQHHVQVAVCDYNYAFDPYVALSDFSAESDLSDTILIIDEIHNLVDRGRRYYSPSLNNLDARRAADAMSMGPAPVHGELADLCYRLEELIEYSVADFQPPGGQTRWAFEQMLPEDELWRLRPRFDQLFVDYLEYRRETRTLTADDLFVMLYFDLLKFLNALVLSDNAFSHYLERDGEEYRLQILCKDPSRFLGGVIKRCHSVIGLSATLSPTEFYRDLLGFERERTVAVGVPNPFPTENRRIVIDTSVATTWRERPMNYGPIADQLSRFGDAVPGNTLALFPSYRFLAEVASQMTPQRKRILVQNPGDGHDQRQEILETLRGALFGDILLLAVAGGVFAEGVDYPGEMLKAVAVVGPCLPAVTLDQELLKSYYDERFDRGFEYAFVVPGMTRVVQAAGRLIRSQSDVGVIALLDQRFLRRPYREHLPSHWLPAEGVRSLSGDPGEAAERFFREIGRRGDSSPRSA